MSQIKFGRITGSSISEHVVLVNGEAQAQIYRDYIDGHQPAILREVWRFTRYGTDEPGHGIFFDTLRGAKSYARRYYSGGGKWLT